MTPKPLRVYLGTEEGLHVGVLDNTSFRLEHTELKEQAVRSLAVHPANPEQVFVGCGLRGWGLHRTCDGGRTVESLGFEDRWVWGVTVDPVDPEIVYVGTEPPGMYRSTDSGHTFTELTGATAVPSRESWQFYHEPFGGGHIHAITKHPECPQRLVAGVEDGPLLVSSDHGKTWEERFDGNDLHRIAMDPRDPDRWFIGTGDGLFETVDAGASWEEHDTLSGSYVHGVEFAPHNPEHLWVYAAETPPVYASFDGGESWSVRGDLPPGRGADPIAFHPDDRNSILYAGGDHSGNLYLSTDYGDTWELVTDDIPKVWRLAVGRMA